MFGVRATEDNQGCRKGWLTSGGVMGQSWFGPTKPQGFVGGGCWSRDAGSTTWSELGAGLFSKKKNKRWDTKLHKIAYDHVIHYSRKHANHAKPSKIACEIAVKQIFNWNHTKSRKMRSSHHCLPCKQHQIHWFFLERLLNKNFFNQICFCFFCFCQPNVFCEFSSASCTTHSLTLSKIQLASQIKYKSSSFINKKIKVAEYESVQWCCRLTIRKEKFLRGEMHQKKKLT